MTVFILPKENIFVPNVYIECSCLLLVFVGGEKKEKKKKKLEKRNVKDSQAKNK